MYCEDDVVVSRKADGSAAGLSNASGSNDAMYCDGVCYDTDKIPLEFKFEDILLKDEREIERMAKNIEDIIGSDSDYKVPIKKAGQRNRTSILKI